MARTKHSNQEYLALLAKLRKHGEWYDGGHGDLHGEAADAIEELIADSGLEVPPGSQIPPPARSGEPIKQLSEEEREEDLEQDMEEERGSKSRPHGKARSR